MELTWNLPGSKSDHKALGVKRTWPCICGHMAVPCPYHLAKLHMEWLKASSHSSAPDAPLFPNARGGMPSKAAVVSTFEAIGRLLQQPLWSEDGLRLFGGHSPRVTGAQLFAALGIDINKIRILARHSGETIMRYVQEAPLKSLRADLGLTPQGTIPMPFAAVGKTGDTVSQRRLHSLTEALARLEALVEEQSQEIANIRAEAASDTTPKFVRHSVTATVHRLRPSDASRTICGICVTGATFRARRQDGSTTYLPIDKLDDIPGILLCDRCLHNERTGRLSGSSSMPPSAATRSTARCTGT